MKTSNMTEYITPNQILNNLINLLQLIFKVTGPCNLKCKYVSVSIAYIMMILIKTNNTI